MIRRLAALLTVLLLLPVLAAAQSYPLPRDNYVNDFAQVLSPGEVEELRALLRQAWDDPGAQITVLTLPSRMEIAPELSLEDFATGLFDTWGIGDAQDDDGILLLVLTEDREARIELGAAYGREWDATAQAIMDTSMLPAFAEGAWGRGLKRGAERAIAEIATRHAEGKGPGGGGIIGIPGLAAIAVFLALALKGKWLPVVQTLARKCPSCGRRGLTRDREVLTPASLAGAGEANDRFSCPHCGYNDTRLVVLPQLTNKPRTDSRSDFGGGSSGGGGASGRF